MSKITREERDHLREIFRRIDPKSFEREGFDFGHTKRSRGFVRYGSFEIIEVSEK